MQLSPQLASQIATQAQAILNRRVLVADTNGYILAGLEHTPSFSLEALQCAQSGQQLTAEFKGTSTKWAPFVYDEATVAVFGLSLAAGPLTPEAFSLIFGLAEVLTYQCFLGHRLQSLEMMRSDFIREVLTSPQIELDDLQRRADILQLDLRHPQAIVLARLGSSDRTADLSVPLAQLGEKLRQELGASSHDLVTYLDAQTLLIIQGLSVQVPTTQNTIRFMTERAKIILTVLTKLQQLPVTVGVGQYYPQPDGLRKSYQDANLALEVGRRVWGDGRLYHIRQVGMFVTLANTTQERKTELAYQILSPLLADEQLFKTVRTFLVTGLNLTEAAAQLHIHRNTLIYRLDKTKKLISLDPRNFDDALQIKLGLMFYQPTSKTLDR